MGFSPYEILYGHFMGVFLPVIKVIMGDLNEIDHLTLRQQIWALGSTLTTLHCWVREQLPVSLTTDSHPFI